jgi:hypothetical protein
VVDLSALTQQLLASQIEPEGEYQRVFGTNREVTPVSSPALLTTTSSPAKIFVAKLKQERTKETTEDF